MKSISACSKFLLVLLAASQLAAQTAFITGSGYTAPPPIQVAPGQVATFFVAGLPAENVTANVTIGGVTTAAPIVATNPQGQATTAVTVQLPFTLAGTSPYTVQFCSSGACTSPVSLQQIAVDIHIITTCDVFYPLPVTPCQPAITHASGALVTPTAPAQSGEIITIWAFGLGLPAGGLPATPGPVVMNDIALSWQFVSEWFLMVSTPVTYQFAGLPSANAGLYQVNFAAPQVPAGMTDCGTQGNLSISLTRDVSSAGFFTPSVPSFIPLPFTFICVVPAT